MGEEFTSINGSRFESIECGQCGITFFAPQHWIQVRRDNGDHGGEFHCPNGHTRVWRESELTRVRRERDRLKQDQARLEDEARVEREARTKAEAAAKRLKKRAAAGSCPCCKRSFSNMARHMKQHPQFVSELVSRPPLKVVA